MIKSLNQQFNFNHVNFKEKIFLRKIMQIPVKQRESVCDFALFDPLMTLLPFLLHQWDCVSNLSNSSFYLCFLFCMFVFCFFFFLLSCSVFLFVSFNFLLFNLFLWMALLVYYRFTLFDFEMSWFFFLIVIKWRIMCFGNCFVVVEQLIQLRCFVFLFSGMFIVTFSN